MQSEAISESSESTVQHKVNVTVDRSGGFCLKRKWLSKASEYAISVGFMWNGFAGLFAAMSFYYLEHSKLLTEDIYRIWLGVFGLFFIAGLRPLYRAFQEIFNTTTIKIKDNVVTVTNSPFYLGPRLEITGHSIKTFSSDVGPQTYLQSGPRDQHFLCVVLRNRDIHSLCPADSIEEVQYMCEAIESYLGIRDQKEEFTSTGVKRMAA